MNLHHHLVNLIKTHAAQLFSSVSAENLEHVRLEKPRQAEHGDYSTNIAMLLAKPLNKKPREIAEILVDHLFKQKIDGISDIQIAGAGFINFYLKPEAFQAIIPTIINQSVKYGVLTQQHPEFFNIEFVSSNPNGPLHVGHGRGAAFGSVLANLLQTAGHRIYKEYYINDAGRQMDILSVSLWIRYLSLKYPEIPFPQNGYKGDYVIELARQLVQQVGETWIYSPEQVFSNLPLDEQENGEGDKEAYIDALIERAKQLLSLANYRQLFHFGLSRMLEDIHQDLEEFGVTFHEWFSEASLAQDGTIKKVLEKLEKAGHLYEKEGALWFRSTEFGDDKDRVLIRANGQSTYFASDVAYLWNKVDRGFDKLIYIWGADHHGYIARIHAAAQALGIDPERIKILLVQLAALYSGKEKISMSTRAGSFVTLRQLREEVGKDAARFYYVMRKFDQHMDFDLELAKSQTKNNPVFYVQYAHARICSVFRQYQENTGLNFQYQPEINLQYLQLEQEKALLKMLISYPDVIACAARDFEPHQLINYLIELSQIFHAYYNDNTILVEDNSTRLARLSLLQAIKQVYINSFSIIGITALERL